MQIGGGGGIKNILRGVITIPYTNTTATATISAVNVGKSELRLLGNSTSETGTDLRVQSAHITLTNSTTITASRFTSAVGGAVNLSWELTEFN